MKVTIVGAGIAGLATAWALTRRGHAVTLLEQAAAIPNPLAASGDQHRIIRKAYGASDGYARAMPEAFAAWDELWGDLGRSHYAPCGVLGVSLAEGDKGEVYRLGLERNGTPYSLHEAPEALRLWPFLNPEKLRYAFFSRDGGALFPARIAADLQGWLAGRGAVLRAGAQVTGIDTDAATVTLADGETIAADRVVVSAGAWVTRLFPDLAPTLTPARTAVVYLDPPADLAEAWRRAPVLVGIDAGIGGYVLPAADGTDMKFGAGIHRRYALPDAESATRPGEGEQIRDYFAPVFARIGEYRVKQVRSCVYTFTADERFFAERRGRTLVVSTCSGHGYKFGAAIGRRVADGIETGDTAALQRWLRAE